MIITDHTYVAVLRWKAAEKIAVRGLSPEIKRSIVPIIEIVPKDFWEEPAAAAINNVGKELAENWGWRNPIILDPHLLGNEIAARNVAALTRAVARYNIPCGIVTDVSRPETYQSQVERAMEGVKGLDLCLRINVFDLRLAGLDSAVREILARFRRRPKDVHMILDFGLIAEDGMNFRPLVNSLPMLSEWRSVTTLAGSFPKDLSDLTANEQHILRRGEWESWCSLNERSPLLTTFGDYTIQHPFFEDPEGKGYNFSASIRYTCPEAWLIMRGEGVRNEGSPGYQQWLAEAVLLCERTEFAGAGYSWGDTFIKDKSNEPLKTGGAKEWLAATINHHLTLVVKQVRELKAATVSKPQQARKPDQSAISLS